MAGYQLRTFAVPAELEELFTAELWARGALGFEICETGGGELRLAAYFPASTGRALGDSELAAWRLRGVREIAAERLAERDWLADYRATVEPFDVGRGFRVDPRDPAHPEASCAGSRRLLRVPARTAFGTGSHESTRLAIAWLEAYDLSGLKVLDVGTGSGILAFVAEALGAARVVGLDVDAQAVCVARANARLNQLSPQLFAGSLPALSRVARFDLAVVNILPEHVRPHLPHLVRCLQPGAGLISSGNLTSRRDELLAVWAESGLALAGEKREGEWVAWLLRATP